MNYSNPRWTTLPLLLMLAFATSAAQAQNARTARNLTDTELQLTADEQQIQDEQFTERRTESVAEKYRDLLTRDAVPITPSERGDPMIIPFIYEKVMLEELGKRLEDALLAGNNNLASVVAKNIVRQFPGSPEATRAREVLVNLIDNSSGGDTGPTTNFPVPELDAWVRANTRSILYDSRDPRVLIDTHVLGRGATVPGYANHVIEDIRTDAVIYRVSNEYQTRTFEVTVNSGF